MTEAALRAQRKYRAKPEAKALAAARARKFRRTENGIRKTKNQNLKAKYGISLDDYEHMVREQGGCCLLCKEPGPLVVDHDHVTGVVRALLCFGCNSGLGLLDDCPTRMREAAEYVEQYRSALI